MRDCGARHFRVTLEMGHRAYLISFAHCSFYECYFVLRAPAGLEDAGESVTFNQCVLFNAHCLIANIAGFGLRVTGCALDYAARIVWDNKGRIGCVACHIEFTPRLELPFHNGLVGACAVGRPCWPSMASLAAASIAVRQCRRSNRRALGRQSTGTSPAARPGGLGVRCAILLRQSRNDDHGRWPVHAVGRGRAYFRGRGDRCSASSLVMSRGAARRAKPTFITRPEPPSA